MKALVTGGAGFIGSHACTSMLAHGHSVMIYDNFSNSSKTVISRIRQIKNGDLNYITGDINDDLNLRNAFEFYQPDVVVHFAGLKSVKESVYKPLAYYRTNVTGTLKLLECMEIFDCPRIIFSSSATVYGLPSYLPFDEEHPIAPINPYGRTKAISEKLIKDWVRSQESKSAVCLRYFNPIGAHESGMIGEDPHGMPNNLMPLILQVAKGQRKTLSIYGNDYETRDGTGERDYVHVMDIADAHVKAMVMQKSKGAFEIFNLGTGIGTTVKELVTEFESVTGIRIPYKMEQRRQGDVAQSWSNTDRARASLSMQRNRSLQEMCYDSWHWTEKNPNGYVP